jgi:phosphotriesterase-related protein
LGDIPVHRLGVTLPHEHLLFDLRCWFEPAKSKRLKALESASVKLGNIGELTLNPWACRDNLRMVNPAVAINEVKHFRDAGGRSVVDCTTEGIARDVSKLQRISAKVGVNIIAGTGYYTEATHPRFVKGRSVEELAARMVREIEEGVGATGIRCGIIGEIGTSLPPTKAELKVLRGAAIAQSQTGAPLNIHVSGPVGARLLDVVEAEGAESRRVVMSHSDVGAGFAGVGYLLSLASRGCFVELDTLGSHIVFPRAFVNPKEKGFSEINDVSRIGFIVRLIDSGHLDQILLSHDAWYKIKLKKFGGGGYAHLLQQFVPMLLQSGISKNQVRTMVVENPGRMLAF